MKTLSTLFFTMVILYPCQSQNIHHEMVDVALYQLPLKPLHVTQKTYLGSIQDLGKKLHPHQIKELENALAIPGFSRSEENAAVQIELIVNPLSVTNKEIKDDPFTIEKNGIMTVYHNYHYILTCSFPAKLRITRREGQITEQDLPGFFQTKYEGQQANTEMALQNNWDQDYSFLETLQKKRIAERVKELNALIFSQYGYGMNSQWVSIGYVKDKKGDYNDLTKALVLTRDAFLYASDKEIYLDKIFKGKTNEAILLYETALTELSEDKKARINQRVAAMIYYNLGLIYFGLEELDKAREYIHKMKNPSRNSEMEARTLLNMIKDRQNRFAANGILKNKSIPGSEQHNLVQKPADKIKLERDYLVGKQRDTLYVRFLLPSTEVMPYGDTVWLQDKVIVLKDDQSIELYPDDIHGFCYNGIYRESLWWVKDLNTNPWTLEKKFCKRIIGGAIQVYTCNDIITDEEGFKKVTATLYYKKNDRLLEVMFLNFDRGVSKLVSEYEELSEKVRSGGFHRDDFLGIIQEYNNYSAAKTSN